jgi:hypothetical protein
MIYAKPDISNAVVGDEFIRLISVDTIATSSWANT